jgi:hypothetical protein
VATPQLLTFFKTFTTDAHGQIFLTGIVDIKEHRQADLEILQFPGAVPNISVSVTMGKISGSTLAQQVGSFALSSTAAAIHTFNVVGPEMSVVLTGGPANTAVNIQAWLFVH